MKEERRKYGNGRDYEEILRDVRKISRAILIYFCRTANDNFHSYRKTITDWKSFKVIK